NSAWISLSDREEIKRYLIKRAVNKFDYSSKIVGDIIDALMRSDINADFMLPMDYRLSFFCFSPTYALVQDIIENKKIVYYYLHTPRIRPMMEWLRDKLDKIEKQHEHTNQQSAIKTAIRTSFQDYASNGGKLDKKSFKITCFFALNKPEQVAKILLAEEAKEQNLNFGGK
ncbi:MAG: hypothetical protein ACK4PR_10815, partial [Gammaproteobacteria bacterium]